LSRTPARRLFASILASDWAIRPDWLEHFACLADRLGDGAGAELSADEIRTEIRRALATLNEGRQAPPGAIAFDRGLALGGETRATVRDGVAIIPVMGPLYHYADEMHDVCGCSSYAQIATDIAAVRAAAQAGRVRAALLEVDSPGGEVGGIAETAGIIADLAAELPMATYVPDLGASAAYWLGVATGRVVVAPTSMLGSIGVVAAARRADPKSPYIEIVSSQSPKKRPNAETDAGRAQIQARLDSLAEVFMADVARYRGVALETVANDFGQGDVLVGGRAVAAGLANELGTFEGLLQELSGKGGLSRAGSRAAAVAGSGVTSSQDGSMPPEKDTPAAPPAIDRAYLDKHHSDLVKALLAEGKAQGVTEGQARGATAERERITGVLGLLVDENGVARAAAKGFESIVTKAIAKPGQTKPETALELLDAREAKDTRARSGHLDKLRADEGRGTPPPSGGAVNDDSEAALAARAVRIHNQLQGETAAPSRN
jgi:ClpP class serine protease